MKAGFTILFFFALHPAFAQREVIKNHILRDRSLQVIVSNSNIREISFYKNHSDGLRIRPDSFLTAYSKVLYGTYYSMNYLGHRYLFEKQYGFFPAETLLKKLDSLSDPECYTHYYEGQIYADKIKVKITSNCPGKSTNDEDRVFEKVENSSGYFGGTPSFQQMVRDRLSCAGYREMVQEDTAFFFTALVKRDSICHEVKNLDVTDSPLQQLIRKTLLNTCGWKPYVKDGHNMSAYLQFFIRFRKDGSIEADYYH